MRTYSGELAALATALCWTASATFFTLGTRRVGAIVVNRVRLLLAAAFLVFSQWVVFGIPLPLDAGLDRWFWLGLSGVIGLAIGDAFLFQAYVWIGAQQTMLMMTAAPVISAALAWLAFGERLSLLQIVGIAMTIAGIVWVVAKRDRSPLGAKPQDERLGLLFGLGAATCQALGLVLAKQGLGSDLPPLSGNVIRMVTASAALWLVTLLQGQAGATVRRIVQNKAALAPIAGGSFFGPFIGVWLSLFAIQRAHIGVASTLMALPPVFLIPVARIVFAERIGWQAITGTLLALAGVGVLFLA
jgi:drug/metabolite transporter (DMT)-like permease